MRKYVSLVAFFAISFASQAHAQQSRADEQVAVAPANISSLTPRQIIRKTPVAYPKSVVPQDREASVVLRYTIEPDGHVDHLEIVKGATAAFNNEALRAVGDWLYRPAGKSTPGAVAIVDFHAAP